LVLYSTSGISHPEFMLKRTPLFGAHQKLGGKLIEFGGWEMPVQYTSIMDEHLAVRKAAGIFDISHMGEVLVTGPAARAFLNHMLTNDAGKAGVGQGQYTLMCNERGGVIDDLYLYRLGGTSFLLIINASRIEADWSWLEKGLKDFPQRKELQMANLSDETAAVAAQGPLVAGFIDQLVADAACGGTAVSKPAELKKNQIASFNLGKSCIHIARTGYTGEDGFEVVAPAAVIEAVWNRLMDAGRPFGLKPCGLGARDTLRTEVCYPLYGHELDEYTTPMEAGLGFFVSLDKGEFVGRPVLAEQKSNGVRKKCIAFKMTDKSAPPRPHYPIWANGANVGDVTSGTQSPSLGAGIGMGFIPTGLAKPGTAIEIEIRGRRAPAMTVPKPIYRKS
jgi:aminomethyltransferase